jgi:hypothetical protein
MELQAFVQESLKQIIAGIADASKEAKGHGASINPRQSSWHDNQCFYFDRRTGSALTTVEFDIAVTASDSAKTKGGIAVAVASVVLGSQAESSKANQQVSRIRFSIPVVLPCTDDGSE